MFSRSTLADSAADKSDFSMTRKPSLLTRVNQRANIPWGDLLEEKEKHSTRIYIQNVNGLSLDRRGGQFNDICTLIQETQADIFCGQEHNLDTSQMHVRSVLFDTARQYWTRNRLIAGTSPISFASMYKPGGTFILSIGNVSGRVINQVQDKWGRWVIQDLTGRNGTRIAIISAYQPVDKRGMEGNLTVSGQQRSLLLQSQDSTDNPRTAFRRDLLSSLRTYHKEEVAILLVGDFNEQFGSDPDGLSFIANELALVNLSSARHPARVPATYARGSKCLDYALGSIRVRDALLKVGYEAFNARLASDHRGLFLDFNTDLLFGSPNPDLVTYQKRVLQAHNVAQVTAYINQKYELLLAHNAFTRADHLTLLGDRHQFAEKLDRDVLAASLSAENSIPQFGIPAWSVELAQARDRVKLLRKCMSALRTGLDHTQLFSQMSQPPDESDIPSTVTHCSKMLRAAKQQVTEIVQESFRKRTEERKLKIKELEQSAATADRKTAQMLRRLKKAEDIKALFQKIKGVRSKHRHSGLVRLEIPLHPHDDPKSCTEWTQIDVPHEIVALLQERNRHHFGQAHGTPFTVPPLSEALGYTGTGNAQRQILHGSFDSPELNSNVQLLIRHLKYSYDVMSHPSRPTINDDEFSSKLKVWSESTTTSPSGVHLGHYKALIARHSFSTDQDDDDLTAEFRAKRDELNYRQQALRSLHLSLINYALERGYSYQRWQKVANTILFKDPDNVRLHRTRVIHIYEADFNLALGIKWRAAMHQAEDLQVLNDGQYGSRPYRSAIEPVFLEELQLEISRATRKPVVLTNYDATACYDRIIPNLGMTVSQKYGVSPSVTECNAATLEKASFHVRTELGLAKEGYNHEPAFPIYGTGQGSANSPAIWCFLSSTLFDCYDTLSHKAQYTDTSGTVSVDMGMIGFVDDCNGQTNSFASDGSQATVRQLVAQAQKNAQYWTDLLSASGGALELTKCSCHILQWNFSMRGAPVLVPTCSTSDYTINVWDSNDNEPRTIQSLSPYTAHKTLGHFKDPAGTQREQFRQLKKKSDESTAFLWSCPLTRLEAWTFYYACYLPSVTYPLASSSLTQQQLDRVQKQAMSIIVPRCGFNRNTKKEILYGPLALGGASFRSLYTHQGVAQTVMFIRQWRKQSMAGKLLRIAVSWFQEQIGTSFSFLQNVQTPLPHLESKWLSSLRHFLASINATLQLDKTYVCPLQRAHDFHIMDEIMSSRRFSTSEIRRLNYCRLYLKAVTAADLVMIDGRTLDHNKTHGEHSLLSSFTPGTRIYQEKPLEAEWKLWRRANDLWSTRDGRMIQPLGDWIINIHTQFQRHHAYWYDGILWIHIEQSYTKCVQEKPRVFRETRRYRTWENLPPKAIPMVAFPTADGTGCWAIQQTSTMHDYNSAPIGGTFKEYVETFEPWEVELLTHVEMEVDPFALAVALEHGVRAVSDGSDWYHLQGSFGWAMSTDLGERCARGMGPARSSSPHAYRSESYGMLSMLCFLKRLAEFTGKHDYWVGVVATDSQSLVDTILAKPSSGLEDDYEDPFPSTSVRPVKGLSLDPLLPEWDIVKGIQVLLQEMPQLSLQHVRGHQDKHTPYRQLALLAQLNVDADAQAAHYQRNFGSFQPDVLMTTWTGVHLVTSTGTITSHYDTALRYLATAPPLEKYMRQKYKWSEQVFGSINWSAHGGAHKKYLHQRAQIVKLVHGILPINAKLHRTDPRRQSCPSCKQCVETWTHLMRCDTPPYGKWRESMLVAVAQKCDDLHTSPPLKKVLLDGIRSWFSHQSDEVAFRVDPAPDTTSALRRLVFQQNEIGWDQLFFGRFSSTWGDLQDESYARRAQSVETTKMTGQYWQKAIIGCIWDQWLLMWAIRNQTLHGADKAAKTQAERRVLERSLIDIYDLRNHMEPSVQQLLCRDVTEHFTKTVTYNKNWLTIYGPLVKASVKRAKEKAIQGVRSIRQYFSIQ